MDSSYEFGRRVTPSEAHAFIEGYKILRDTLINEILELIPPDAAEAVRNSATFHKSKVNAFVFDAALVKSMFDGPEPASYFAVFLGASGVNPTVVAMGLVEGSPNTLVPRSAEDDIQHPRLIPGASYPGLGNNPIIIEN
jgi:hypothetical protein